MSRLKGTIFLSVFVAMLGVMILAPITPAFIREVGLLEIHSGILISTGSIITAIMAPIWGIVSDRKGRKPVIVAGLIGLTVSTALLAMIFYLGLHGGLIGGRLLFWLIVMRSMVGLFIPAILSASQALMGDLEASQQRGSGMAVISAANGMGLILGPAIAGIFSLIDMLWPLYFGIVITAVAVLTIMYFMPATASASRPAQRQVKLFRQPSIRLYLFAAFVTMAALFTVQVVGGFYLQDRLALSSDRLAWTVSFGLMLTGVALLVAQIIQSKRLKWRPPAMIVSGSGMLIGSMGIFVMTTDIYSYFLSYLLLGAGAGFMMTGFLAGASLTATNEQQGRIAGLVTAVQGLAAIVAPVVSTSLYQADQRFPLAAIALLSALAGLSVLVARRKRVIT